MPIIKLENLSKQFGKEYILKDINLELDKGSVVCLIGPSGAGKTTLLRCISMLESFEEGKLIINNKFKVDQSTSENEKEKLRKKIGVVFQEFHLWPHKTILENIAESLILVKKLSKNEAVKEAKEWLNKIDLINKADNYPEDLSGGQKQRVAIARTLVMKPDVVLLDEITAALDPELVAGILKIIKRLTKDGMTMLVVTHHMRFAREIADKIIFLDKGEIIEEGIPEMIFEKPQNKRTQEFLAGFLEKKQEINVYEGYEDFQAYQIGLLKRVKTGCTGYVVGAVGDRWFECMGNAYQEYEKILKEKKIIWKWVSYKIDKFEKEVQRKLGKQLQISLIPKEYATPSNFNIWEDTIILQTFGETPAIIEIRNKALTSGYLNYFDLLWDIGKKI